MMPFHYRLGAENDPRRFRLPIRLGESPVRPPLPVRLAIPQLVIVEAPSSPKRERSKWRLIDTVPFGEWCLLWVVADGRKACIEGKVTKVGGSKCGMIWNGSAYAPNCATHWMPLPKGPKGE